MEVAIKILLFLLSGALVVTGFWHVFKPLPGGISFESRFRPIHEVEFLADHTWVDDEGRRHTDQEIFDRIFELIGQASELVVLDMFLFNAMEGPVGDIHRPLSRELTDVLLERIREKPQLTVVVITDPFNRLYGGAEAAHFDELERAGARVVYTDLNPLRDSNPAWSAIWRLCCQWFGNSTRGWLPNLVGDEPVTLRTYLEMLNFKANHRKALVADEGDDWVGLVTSGNPHDASSAHVNTALVFRGPLALDLLESEAAVLRMSGEPVPFRVPEYEKPVPESSLRGRVLTESRIRDAALEMIHSAADGDRLDIAMFYFSHGELVRAVEEAAARGVKVRALLDPNKDAFGREKRGIPNRQTGRRFHDGGVEVRWCLTSGEQCHSKQMLLQRAGGSAELLTGSANFTRRNLDDYNLETNIQVIGPADAPLMEEAAVWFERRWHNEPDWRVSLPFEAFEDRSLSRRVQAWIGENLGFSSF